MEISLLGENPREHEKSFVSLFVEKLVLALVHFDRRIFVAAKDKRRAHQGVTVERDRVRIESESRKNVIKSRIFLEHLLDILAFRAVEHENDNVLLVLRKVENRLNFDFMKISVRHKRIIFFFYRVNASHRKSDHSKIDDCERIDIDFSVKPCNREGKQHENRCQNENIQYRRERNRFEIDSIQEYER